MNTPNVSRLRLPELPPALAPLAAILLLLTLAVGVFASHATTAPLDDIEAQSALAVHAMHSPLDALAWDATASGQPAAPLLAVLVATANTLSPGPAVGVLAVRLPSLMGGLMLLVVVVRLVAREYGLGAGVTAGLAVLGSLIFFRDVHQGSPLMLQAAASAGYLLAQRLAMTAQRLPVRIASVGLAWLCAALIVVAGAFVLALLVALAGLIHALSAPRSARWTGLSASAVSLAILLSIMGMLGARSAAPLLVPVWVEPTQLWIGVRNPLLVSALLWLAWLPAILAGVVFVVRRAAGAGWLALIIIVLAMVMAALAPRYLESLWAVTLAPVGVLAALGVRWICVAEAGSARIYHALMTIWLGLCVAGSGVFLARQPVVGGFLLSLYALIAAALLLLATVRLIWPANRTPGARWQSVALAGVAAVVILMQAGAQDRAWTTTRFYQAGLAQSLRAYPTLPLVALLPVRPAVFRYYLARPVALVSNARTLCAEPWDAEAAPRLLLLHPADVAGVERAGVRLELLEQSPGSIYSSVIAARLRCNTGADAISGQSAF